MRDEGAHGGGEQEEAWFALVVGCIEVVKGAVDVLLTELRVERMRVERVCFVMLKEGVAWLLHIFWQGTRLGRANGSSDSWLCHGCTACVVAFAIFDLTARPTGCVHCAAIMATADFDTRQNHTCKVYLFHVQPSIDTCKMSQQRRLFQILSKT